MLNIACLNRHKIFFFFHNLIIVPILIRAHVVKLKNKTFFMPRFLTNKIIKISISPHLIW